MTFLFTDIQGSTRAWEADTAAMADAVERHDAVLRQAIEGAGGYVFKTVGDAFCAAFQTACAAVDAAVQVQRAVAAETWPGAVEIVVRAALHSGEAQERDGDYFGPVVNRTARLETIATGARRCCRAWRRIWCATHCPTECASRTWVSIA